MTWNRKNRNKKGKMRVLRVLAGLIAAGILCEALLLAAVCWNSHKTYPEERADCVIVLGARVWPEGEVSNSLAYRLNSAMAAYEAGRAEAIIVTGAQGADEPKTEAAAAREYLLAHGIPDEAIVLEEQSRDTVENLRNAKQIMEARGWRTALVATSDYHITRAMWIAEDVGLNAFALPAESPHKPSTWVRNHLRETGSWVVYWVKRLVG